MAMEQGIAHGKEHRKPWRGKDRSKNFAKSCRNHGGCPYCTGNRQFNARRKNAEAEAKLQEG